jgi:hypothetical protein
MEGESRASDASLLWETNPSTAMAEAEKPHPTAGEDGNPSQAFVDDPHISFDKESGKWRYETEDGREFEYDMIARAWVPLVRLGSVFF